MIYRIEDSKIADEALSNSPPTCEESLPVQPDQSLLDLGEWTLQEKLEIVIDKASESAELITKLQADNAKLREALCAVSGRCTPEMQIIVNEALAQKENG